MRDGGILKDKFLEIRNISLFFALDLLSMFKQFKKINGPPPKLL